MDGKPKNKLNVIWKEIERDNKEVAQDGVESAASPLRVRIKWESCLAQWAIKRGHGTSKSRDEHIQRQLA